MRFRLSQAEPEVSRRGNDEKEGRMTCCNQLELHRVGIAKPPCAVGRAISVVFAAWFAVLAIASLTLPSSALAQIAENPDPISLGDLFTSEDSVDLTPDATLILQGAALLGQAEGNCPKGTITIVVAATDDPLFQEALVRARLEIVEQALGDHALDWRLETIHDGFANEVKVQYGRSDQEPPRLDVVWTPPQGSEVAPGDTITATIVANDDFDTFQTGIASISMAAGNDTPFGHEYPQPPENCQPMTPEQQMEGFYVVPDPAPAQVNMRATAKDFAGNEIDLLAAFPVRREPCASGVYWNGWIHGSWDSGTFKETAIADPIRLCEQSIMPPLEYLQVGLEYYRFLTVERSTITYLVTDTIADNSCVDSGEGTSPMVPDLGVMSSVLEAIGANGELQWSLPTYRLNGYTLGTYTQRCVLAERPEILTVTTGMPIISTGFILDGNTMRGRYVSADGFQTADWDLTRQGEVLLYPLESP